MVRIDLDIAACLYGQVKQPVPAKLSEHVVEERQAGLGAPGSAAVKAELDQHLGLVGDPADAC